MLGYILFLVTLLAVSSAFPADPVLYKLDEDRFQYVADDEGNQHLVDLWVKASDLRDMARFTPDTQNSYHLFTRNNPSHSEVLYIGNSPLTYTSNFDVRKRTVILIHGWTNSVTSSVNTVLVPAFLSAEDVNVIVVDWSVGAAANYVTAMHNTVISGESVARFISWLNSVTGASLSSYIIAGHSLGGHQAGIVGRNLGGQVPYVISLDPASPGWISNNNRFTSTDGIYTEVIHTNVGVSGYLAPLGDVDFYPNGGLNMPGCDNQSCDHHRAYYYFAESVSSGGFTGTQCTTYLTALTGNCHSQNRLKLGGITPKTGQSGVYYVPTNAAPPFSQG